MATTPQRPPLNVSQIFPEICRGGLAPPSRCVLTPNRPPSSTTLFRPPLPPKKIRRRPNHDRKKSHRPRHQCERAPIHPRARHPSKFRRPNWRISQCHVPISTPHRSRRPRRIKTQSDQAQGETEQSNVIKSLQGVRTSARAKKRSQRTLFQTMSSLFRRSINASTFPSSPRRNKSRPSTPLRKKMSVASGIIKSFGRSPR